MRTRDFKFYLPEKYKKIDKLKSLLIRSGNKERTNSFFIRLLQVLKTCATIKDNRNSLISFASKNPLNALGEKDPMKILDKCLYNLMPAFILRRTFVAGRFYSLPVPISDNHARFMAADWLRKAAFKDNKNAFTVPYLLAREVGTVLHNTGSACAALQNYIDTALDQRPFSRYIRKKRKIVAISKQGYAAYKLGKQYRKSKKIIKMRKARKAKNKTISGSQRKNVRK
jgi:ribosomal protein S7